MRDRLFVGFVEVVALEDDRGAVAARARHFDLWCPLGHHDGGRDAQPSSMEGHSLRMVARRRGDDPAGPLLGREREHLVQGTALFERTRPLEVFELDVELFAPGVWEVLRERARRAVDGACNARSCGLDILDGDHGWQPPSLPLCHVQPRVQTSNAYSGLCEAPGHGKPCGPRP